MSKRSIIKIACWVVGALVVVGLLMPITVHRRVIHTCLLCRAERTDHKLFGISWQALRDTEFTGWHRSHQPAHEHSWQRCSCWRGRNIFGQSISWTCGPIHPIGRLQPKAQREFAEKADAAILSAFYKGILSTNQEAQKQAVAMAWDIPDYFRRSQALP